MRHLLVRLSVLAVGFTGLAGALLSPTASAGTIPTVHFSDLVAGSSSLSYGEAYGVWSCWAKSSLNIRLFALNGSGQWSTVSTDNLLTKDPVNCPANNPYLASNAWTVDVAGSYASGTKADVVVLALGWKSAAPTSSFALAPTGTPTSAFDATVTWAAHTAGLTARPFPQSVTVQDPNCGQPDLYALDSSGSLGTWQRVAGNCRDAWPVTIAGTQGVGTQKGLTLLATGKDKPLYTYGLAIVN